MVTFNADGFDPKPCGVGVPQRGVLSPFQPLSTRSRTIPPTQYQSSYVR